MEMRLHPQLNAKLFSAFGVGFELQPYFTADLKFPSVHCPDPYPCKKSNYNPTEFVFSLSVLLWDGLCNRDTNS